MHCNIMSNLKESMMDEEGDGIDPYGVSYLSQLHDLQDQVSDLYEILDEWGDFESRLSQLESSVKVIFDYLEKSR